MAVGADWFTLAVPIRNPPNPPQRCPISFSAHNLQRGFHINNILQSFCLICIGDKHGFRNIFNTISIQTRNTIILEQLLQCNPAKHLQLRFLCTASITSWDEQTTILHLKLFSYDLSVGLCYGSSMEHKSDSSSWELALLH
ncbi:hypothetical protein HanRHA438_Chr10g0444261 [Helianthus annuus]|uniref:Uncharacterized protein n=1 Tax=Helianthus annuus TaxID=4232 RepID=A0A251TIF8_HELAN|nr:hypothetical protein HanXRQr2_Chr10g0431781 [Helianthus annuus]KAJ0513220.1 hypothetical protein HanHA300_Chr10g0355061 [Helianthus annuus]KAJ0529343.1 hypothetical protein HanHA89_Chr10g0376741 [Helianthus annuus]KAJ0696228.1 hypothetical protein HanLR1_Chr10g0354631 [Helianthus annuus]KAJ0878824.1 hypothetical protein HanRHA438_Chr10g0444261 [Helianthus annuus]